MLVWWIPMHLPRCILHCCSSVNSSPVEQPSSSRPTHRSAQVPRRINNITKLISIPRTYENRNGERRAGAWVSNWLLCPGTNGENGRIESHSTDIIHTVFVAAHFLARTCDRRFLPDLPIYFKHPRHKRGIALRRIDELWRFFLSNFEIIKPRCILCECDMSATYSLISQTHILSYSAHRFRRKNSASLHCNESKFCKLLLMHTRIARIQQQYFGNADRCGVASDYILIECSWTWWRWWW